jgi:hypothetical protein
MTRDKAAAPAVTAVADVGAEARGPPDADGHTRTPRRRRYHSADTPAELLVVPAKEDR